MRACRRLCFLCLILTYLLPLINATAETTVHTPFQGVRHIAHTATDPHPIVFHLVDIDLSIPHLRFTTTEPATTDPLNMAIETTRDFVTRKKAQIGINTNFFILAKKPHTRLLGLAASNGNLIAPWSKSHFRTGINIAKDNTVTFIEAPPVLGDGYETLPSTPLYNAICGNERLIRNGRDLTKPGGKRHPRTALGLTESNHLLLLIVDGRQPKHSIGMTYHEMSQIFLEYGATNAINLDGGGSSTLVLADPTPRVVNTPLPFVLPTTLPHPKHGLERAVGSNLAIFVPESSSPATAP